MITYCINTSWCCQGEIYLSSDEIKKSNIDGFRKLGKRALLRILKAFKNLIEDQHQEVTKLKEENQKLKDEVNHLKGEKGKPKIKANSKDEEDSEKEKKKGKDKKNWGKSEKKSKIKTTRTKRVPIDQDKLPADAEYKGTRSIVIQDIKLEPDNIKFVIERYYSGSERKSYEGELSEEYQDYEFGPGIRSLILMLHYQGRITLKLLHTILIGMGIIISKGEISEIIDRACGSFEEEKDKAREAGIEKQGFQQIDDTGARIDGKNGFTIATCNEYFATYETGYSKNRMSALKALTGGDAPLFIVDDFAVNHIAEKLSSKTVSSKLNSLVGKKLYNEKEFFREILEHPFLSSYGASVKRYVLESCAIGAYRSNYCGIYVPILICDDAGQFKDLTEYLQLCWVHEGRHYKKLEPYCDEYRKILDTFLDRFWKYYKKLKKYKKAPTEAFKQKLLDDFDKVFKANTDYFGLNKTIEKTIKKKNNLLLVLDYPEIPLHNNACELDVREKVVQRKIRNCHRSLKGAKASDLFLSLMATCRKNNISFWEYLKDRIYGTFNILSLDAVILTGQISA